jgi:hypothetical protein
VERVLGLSLEVSVSSGFKYFLLMKSYEVNAVVLQLSGIMGMSYQH